MVKPAYVCLLVILALSALSPEVAAADASVLTKGKSAKLMCVGDSITLGKDGVTGGYRSYLADWLTASGYPIVYVGHGDDGDPANATITTSQMKAPANHEGYGSFRIDMIEDGGSAEGRNAPPITKTLAAYKPEIVLLMIGTNDIMQDWKLEGIHGRMAKLVETILATDPKLHLLVASIAPISNLAHYPARPGKEEQVVALNAAIKALVAQQQARHRRVRFVDVHAVLEAGGLDQGGVHPDDSGYRKMAAAWYQALTGSAPAPSAGR